MRMEEKKTGEYHSGDFASDIFSVSMDERETGRIFMYVIVVFRMLKPIHITRRF